MVLATLLHMQGLEYRHEAEVRARHGGESVRNCTWVFDEPTDAKGKIAFYNKVDDFIERRCRVEPREFARHWADVRREMFQFLDPVGRA
jgi:hypothetical protein